MPTAEDISFTDKLRRMLQGRRLRAAEPALGQGGDLQHEQPARSALLPEP